jgi:hypothetical protein
VQGRLGCPSARVAAIFDQTVFALDFAARLAEEAPPDIARRVASKPGGLWHVDRRVGVSYFKDASDGVSTGFIRARVPSITFGNSAHQIMFSQWPESMTLKELADEVYLQALSLGCSAADCKLQSRTSETFRGEVAQRLEMVGRLRSHWTVIVTKKTRHAVVITGTGDPDLADIETRVDFIEPL